MGCSDCSSKGGCESRKGTQRAVFDEVLERIYPQPGRTWGRPDDEARFRAGIGRDEARRLSRSLASVAKAPVFFRYGSHEDLCDYVWILCVGRAPALIDVRDGRAEARELVPGVLVEERYLRVAFSTVGRLAAMQEVALTLETPEGGGLSILRELPRAGVFDPILLKRVRSVVALLEASDVSHIDFGLLDKPLAGADPGDYEQRYGVAPRLCNFLFQAAPPTTQVVTVIEAAVASPIGTAAAPVQTDSRSVSASIDA